MFMSSTRLSRLYIDDSPIDSELRVPADRAHYLRNVLRAKKGQSVIVFDGRGAEHIAEIEQLSKRAARLRITARSEPLAESRLEIHLIQAVAKADAMDWIIQKATELGVARIRPVNTEFNVVRLTPERAARRLDHWQRIARAACEQSGRHVVTRIDMPRSLNEVLADTPDRARRIVLDPGTAKPFAQDPGIGQGSPCLLLIGPEGGFSERDLACARDAGFDAARLGPRTLRVETAAVTACALAQAWWGDLG
jgi:16S rRNA (uracil1498-N3)-methyltransferase